MPAEKTPPALDLDELQTSLVAEGQPWQWTTTSMTSLDEEQRRLRLGVPLPPPAQVRAIESAGAQVRAAAIEAASVGAPAAFDSRNVGGVNYVTPIKDQASCGSCVSFGTAATVETTAGITRGIPLGLDLSEAHLFYIHGAGDASCSGGWLPSRAWPKVSNPGITFEDYMPYTPGNSGGAVLNADWPNRLAKSVGNALTGNAAAMKEHLSRYGALSACFIVYQDFFSYRTGVYRHVSGDQAGGHCVSLIGYDDAQACWIAKNSWGTGWGDGGCFRIAYGEAGIETWEVHGCTGVTLRMWTGYTPVRGLWANNAASNAWAYLDGNGWLKLDGAADVTTSAMLAEAIAAKNGGRQIRAFVDAGTINELYVY